MNITAFKSIATNALGRTVLLGRKYAPEILLGVGLTGAITAAVLACKASTKAELLYKQAKVNIDRIHEAKEKYPLTVYSEQDYKQDLITSYTQSTVEFVKLYGPAVTLGIASIALILASHGMMSKRNASLIAAYKLIDDSFSKYRARVKAEFGEEKERKFRFNLVDEVNKKKPKKGEEKTEELKAKIESDLFELSEYAKWFDENSPQWQKDNTHNMFFLQAQQTFANHLLQSRGHVFLNEIYDSLGFPRTKAGAIVGWIKDHGDNRIDFNMYSPSSDVNRDFVNGYNQRRVLLDFNVDGIIYDMI